jgi:hypothetical protein
MTDSPAMLTSTPLYSSVQGTSKMHQNTNQLEWRPRRGYEANQVSSGSIPPALSDCRPASPRTKELRAPLGAGLGQPEPALVELECRQRVTAPEFRLLDVPMQARDP